LLFHVFDFLKLYRDILDEADNEKMNRVHQYFPGVKESLPENLKSVEVKAFGVIRLKN
jgi:hypothetical protein